ncbi:pilus assembly protein [Corticibacter populi]|uniref:Pilus assembly protein n=1 Tax=Corticibacter populi TaxID=1550736 RepID=A0A3M6QV05_9BURK|nr:pilus assembly protein [Corticibacter populi]RMX06856.1 pilus assembly protein [Corticibacter populi]RZS31553.1 Flp pilus assembly protein TadG [Corticibacter populi]
MVIRIPFARTSPTPQCARQRGGATVLLLLLIVAVMALAAYSADGPRMTADAAQLKRATDAAALAATQAYAEDGEADIQAIAERYINANLGMDSAQTGNQLRITTTIIESDGDEGVRVSATFEAASLLNGAGPQDVTVYSTAVARNRTLEVALTIPNTLSENAPNLSVLRRLGKDFAQNLIGERDNVFLSLVPYSQIVNVYDAAHPNRIRQWAAPGALNPVELTSLFRSGYGSLADNRIPDRRANLLCLYRGLNQGENYFWDQAPSGQFLIHYRHDLPINGSPGAPPIFWVGPNPDFGKATGVNDTRYMTADRGCPHAPLLPLTNDLGKIADRLDIMSTRFNNNHAIAIGWAAMSLSPAFRGSAGWGLSDDLPKDFKADGGNSYKAIILLVNSSGLRWFDSDAYNSYVGQPIDGCSSTGSSSNSSGDDDEDSSSGSGANNQVACNDDAIITRRFANLCESLREHDVRFFMIVTGSDEVDDSDTPEADTIPSASAFRRIAGAGLRTCAVKNTDLTYYNGLDFSVSEGKFSDRLEDIISELRQQTNDIRLID